MLPYPDCAGLQHGSPRFYRRRNICSVQLIKKIQDERPDDGECFVNFNVNIFINRNPYYVQLKLWKLLINLQRIPVNMMKIHL